MKVAIIEFPGSSGVRDAEYAFREVLDQEVQLVWHQEEFIKDADLVVIPGGAAFGDYLRPGALTKSSPVVGPIRKYAKEGAPVIGIGNGFQILCELELLPGVLLPNISAEFLSTETYVFVDGRNSPWTEHFGEEAILKLPLGCYSGRYFIDARGLRDLEENDRIAFRYCDMEGEVSLEYPFNGSMNAIAGIYNRHGNVLGMMHHPERAVEESMGNTDGVEVFRNILNAV
jgi:phosphoribosylformylglycinamidine synthase subunit PurQ / glutaminase